MDRDLAQQWARIRARLRSECGESVFRNWLKPLTLIGMEGDCIRLLVPNRSMKGWIEDQYADRLQELWTRENAAVRNIGIAHEESAGPSTDTTGATHRPAQFHKETAATRTQPRDDALNDDGPKDICGPLNSRFSFDNFIVGKPNELAFAAARRVAEAERVPFNPLFLFGGVGLGKTHLMNAIARHIRAHTPDRRIIYLSAEKFMHEFVRALRYKNVMAFKEQYRSVDVLMIDDVQFIAGKESTQEEFFHTFNSLVDQNRQIVISADKSPAEIDGIEERMKSRLGCGLVAEIHSTTYELRLGILQSKAEALEADVPDGVLEFLARKITSNVRELEGALNRIVAGATLVGRPITLDSVLDWLPDVLRANSRKVAIAEIQRSTAEHFNIKLSEMSSARRSRAVARPRQVAMYLCKMLTPCSLPEIGKKFGKRDHTTVMHAVRRVEELCNSDPAFAEDVEQLRRVLEH